MKKRIPDSYKAPLIDRGFVLMVLFFVLMCIVITGVMLGWL